MKHELKACPFCGSDRLEVEDFVSMAYVTCMGCVARVCDATVDEAVACWNRRAGDDRSEFAAALRGLMDRGLITQADVERIGKGQFSG